MHPRAVPNQLAKRANGSKQSNHCLPNYQLFESRVCLFAKPQPPRAQALFVCLFVKPPPCVLLCFYVFNLRMFIKE